MTSNVVDSNMFMRCLILSCEHFSSHQEFSGRKLIISLASLQQMHTFHECFCFRFAVPSNSDGVKLEATCLFTA
jgi:hypothetical protein